MDSTRLEIRGTLERDYADVYTPEALAALNALAHFDADRKAVMAARIARRAERARERSRITFLDPSVIIGRTSIRVQDARDGNFVGSEIPPDLKRQWIQGTGPAARPGVPIATSLRNLGLRAAVGRRRLDVRQRGRSGTGVHDVARQPAQPEAGDRSSAGLSGSRRARGRRR